jgi:methionine-R-sulfoxide reductase
MGAKQFWAMGIVVSMAAAACGLPQNPVVQKSMKGIATSSPKRSDKVILTDAQWRKRLTPAQYKILRASDTEPAFCGKFHDNHLKGTYQCAGCGLPLFSSENKFDSGTGWPSFYQPVSKDNVWFKRDTTFGMERVEVRCAKCDGHLGHVFDDAPETPTGLRYCINSDALTFKKAPPSRTINP